MKIIFALIIQFSMCGTSFTQLKLYPIYGRALSYSKIENSNEHLSQGHAIYKTFIGLSCDKKINEKSDISFSYERSFIGLSAQSSYLVKNDKYGNEPRYRKQVPNMSNKIAAWQNTIGIKYYYHLLNISLKKVDAEYYSKELKLRISPFVGVGINVQETSSWINKCRPDSYFSKIHQDTNTYEFNSVEQPFIYLRCGYDDAVFQNKLGSNFQLGFKAQLIKNGKESFMIGLNYSQGINKIIQSEFKSKFQNLENDLVTGIATYYTRGSFVAFYVSHPITIVNKKGERYRDRHPK